jgi:hypothetical protein
MQRYKALILIGIISVTTIFFSCTHSGSKVDKTMDYVANIIEQRPDSALTLLDSLVYPANLSKSQYNRFMLLLLQAKDKSYKDITSDTAIWGVKNYYFKKKNFPNAAMAAYYCGRVSTEQKRYERALFHYLEAEKYASSIENTNLKGLIQSGMGYVLSNQFLDSEAIPRFHKAAVYFHKANNVKNEAIVYLSIGASFLAEEQIDSAFQYEMIALKMADDLKDSILISNAKQNISLLYRERKNYNLAKKYMLGALPYAKGNDQSTIYLRLAQFYNIENKSDSAKWFIQQSIKSLKDTTDNYVMAGIYKTLSEIDESELNYKGALDNHKKYTDYVASIIDGNENSALIDIQKKYQFEQLKNENVSLALEKQKTLFYSSLGMIALLIGTFFYYRKYTQSKRHELEAEQKIDHLINMAKSFNAKETTFRNVLLHQFDILKKTASLENYSKQQDDSNRSKQLVRKFNEIVYGQDSLNWDRLYEVMNDLHNGFFERLRDKFSDLNEDEFRICCLTYAKFNSMEISIIMGLSVNTIQMKRSSIRKKLGIPPMGNIPNFIDNISHSF